ncbi:small nuclear RNA activating complex (SNAPc), subunit SNAP43 [Rhizoctonia solani]|uniref:Small nuclear RNA activating complex (SNAPc), subunit SNAP43 n=1 Tax=Rhizoctonia solani TaxID=456999 RepID=A0A8H8NNK4_9AGAM|nr:small nuclear RNA activating complex (SNAPc), subunit SNAP43 [Rhizoctonia solani]QRW16999.1 small nuclear RNA activating complex (SNAPc), subunit SNAP43 [Rhizoctonia solani]
MNPTVLPQTFVAISTTDQDTTTRGPGRVTVTNRLRTAKRAGLWTTPIFGDYMSLRTLMADAAGPEIIDNAVQETSQNLRNAEDILVREGMTVEVDPELRKGQLLGLVRDTTM